MEPGQIIADRFELERLVGSGGMGSVYRAKDRLTGGPVAIKLLHVQLSRDVERFRREAQLLAELSHPRVVKYVAHGVTTKGQPYLAMEWLDGEDLAERLARTGLTMAETVLLGRRVAEALGALHERGVVHRDVKPSNLFLPDKEVPLVKLVDLGIARFADPTRRATHTGVMLGTPGYMAPEQARGARGLDGRADVFALGCVLFECLTGTPAFVGDNVAAVLAKILLENSPRVSDMRPDVPEPLDALLSRMLSKHPAVRPADGTAVARELAGLTTIVPEGARPSPSREVRALTGGERRLVSVVMAAPEGAVYDASSPTMTEDTAVASYDRLYAVVAPFGAQLECLANGSLVVTVMGRRSATDQAAHAARCALALRARIASAPMALVTGLAVVSERFIQGDVIDRAATLLGRAQKDDGADGAPPSVRGKDGAARSAPIRLDETTAGLLDQRFEVGGDANGLALNGLRKGGTPSRTLLGKATPFVGRDRELASLHAIFDECVVEPVARVVLVTAAAGVGKSRLAHEFARQAKERYEGKSASARSPTSEGAAPRLTLEVWSARGDPMSEGSPFSMLAQAIRGAAGIAEGEPLVVRQQKLRARVGRHLEGEKLVRVASFIGELAGVPFLDETSVQLRAAKNDAMLMGDQMRRAFEDWFAAELAVQPIVLLLEDLHWGDLPSVKLIESALRLLEATPLMVLAVARPDVHDLFPGLWGEREMQEVRLGALTKRAAEKLVKDVLGETTPPDRVAQLVERAAGNAFYLEELIRAVAEGRGDALPETVLAMVEARLERLDPEARRVLRAASVFGQTFWRAGVLALLGGERQTSEVDEWLDELTIREVVNRTLGRQGDVNAPSEAIAGEHEFVFRHALVREAAYAMLTTEDRTLGHKLAGQWLDSTGQSEAVVLAEHFERGKVPARAIECYVRAAVQALEGNDFEATMQRAERAIACGANGETLGILHLHEAEASNWCGEHREAADYAREAMAELRRGSADWYLAAAELAAACYRLGNRERLDALATDLLALAPDAAVTAGRLIGTARLASRLYFAGSIEAADRLLTWLEPASVELAATDPSVAGWLANARAHRASIRGDLEREIELLESAIRSFEEAGDIRNACVDQQNVGVCLSNFGVYDLAERHLRQALETSERMGLHGFTLAAKQNLGVVFSRRGRTGEAILLEEEAVKGFVASGDAVMEAASRIYLALMLRIQGRLDDAYREACAGVERVKEIGPLQGPGQAVIAIIEVDRGNAREALELATRAARIFEELGGLPEGEAMIHLARAEALHAAGELDAAREVVHVARDRLLERAAKIQNPAWRRSFLEIRENARTLARAGEWLK